MRRSGRYCIDENSLSNHKMCRPQKGAGIYIKQPGSKSYLTVKPLWRSSAAYFSICTACGQAHVHTVKSNLCRADISICSMEAYGYKKQPSKSNLQDFDGCLFHPSIVFSLNNSDSSELLRIFPSGVYLSSASIKGLGSMGCPSFII